MKHNNLTIKQEAFAQAYVKYGDKSKAYREAYSCGKMKDTTINSKACLLSSNGNVRARIEELQEIAKNISEEEFSHTITDSLRLDFELIQRYKKHIAVLENPQSTDKEIAVAKRTIQFIGIKGFDSAMDRISKKLGFYEKNNEQKQPSITLDIGDSEARDKRIKELLAKANQSVNE